MTNPFHFDRLSPSERDFLSQVWSDAHTAEYPFNDSWSRERKDYYYLAFVEEWLIVNEERDFGATYNYLILYEDRDASEFERDPYKHD